MGPSRTESRRDRLHRSFPARRSSFPRTFAACWRRCRPVSRRCLRQPQGAAGRGLRGAGRGEGGRRALHRRRRRQGRRHRRWSPGRFPAGRSARPISPLLRVADPKACALSLAAAALVHPRQPGDDRRRHRHQRQILRRRLHAPDLPDASAMSAASVGTVGIVTANGGAIRLADHARPAVAARLARAGWRGRASAISPWRRHRTVSTSAGSTACGCKAGAFLNLGRDHLDYHPTHRGLSRRQAAPLGAAACRARRW